MRNYHSFGRSTNENDDSVV